MSVGLTVLVLYGSYRNKTDNLVTFSFFIPVMTALCGILAAFVVFSYIGHISKISGIPIDEIPVILQ